MQRVLNTCGQRVDFTSAEVQSLAKSAQDSGATRLDRISRAGSYGNHAKDLFRVLKVLFGHPLGAVPVDLVELPTTRGRKDPRPVLMPHKFVQQLFQHRKDVLRTRITGGQF